MTDSGKGFRELAGSGGNVMSPTGARIGRVDQVYTDDRTGEPTWVTVQTAAEGSPTFIPLRGATLSGDDVVIRYEPDVVSRAPQVADDGSITPAEEAELLRYYEGLTAGAQEREPAASQAEDGAMTRSEERLRVGVQRRVRERVRIRKVIVTEEVTQTIPVRREELVIERVPAGDDAATDLDGADEPFEITLYAERPVVHTEVVPTERIRVTKERVTQQVSVSEDLRSEQIDTTIDHSRPDSGERR